jgi:hypothetical protein
MLDYGASRMTACMQMRPKAYLHLISLWRSLRQAIPPHHRHVPAEASPSLVYAAIVLAFLLAILEVDTHRVELDALGLIASDYPVPTAFVSP